MNLLQRIINNTLSLPHNPHAVLSYSLPSGLSYMLDEYQKTIGFIDIDSPESLYLSVRWKWRRKKVWQALDDFSRQGGKFICIPHWPQFPSRDLAQLFSVICYASLQPEPYLSPASSINIANSDFGMNTTLFAPDHAISKKYDILINTWMGDTIHKGWQHIKYLLPHLKEYHIILIAYKILTKKDLAWVRQFPNVEFYDHALPKEEFAQKIKESKLVLFPNILDASPRVIPQSLLCNVPVLVNKAIYGGLQYVNEKTGVAAAIEDFPNIIPQLLKRYDQYTEARKFYVDNFGFYTTSQKLARFINKQFQTNYKLVYSEEDLYYKQFFTPPDTL